MIPHLPRCTKLTDPTRYACNCGADAQNATAAMLDAADPLATVPAEEQQRILAAADRAANAQPMIAPSVHRDTIRREVAAWHAAHRPALESDREIAERIDADADRAMGQFTTPETLARAEAEPSKNPGSLPAARVTEDELAEFERAAKQIRDGNWPPPGAATILLCERTSDLADEVRALRAERDQASYTIEALQAERESENEGARQLMARIATLESELAARPAPAADASEDDEEPLTRGTRVRTVAHLTALFSPSLHPHRRPNADGKIVRRMTSGDIYYDVRHDDGTVAGYERSELIDLTADASRPGLTEEQAREIAEDVATSFNARWSIGLGQGPLKDMADRIEAGVLRASRGDTGPAPDPRATPHAGDPASPFAPGSLAAGSATEDRILDRKRGGK